MTKPTQQQIRERAERVTRQLGHTRPEPRDPSYDAKLKLYDKVLAVQTREAEAFLTRIHDLDSAREAAAVERDTTARTDLEQRLINDYRSAAPGTTVEEARTALPDLLHRHRMQEIDQRSQAGQPRRRIA